MTHATNTTATEPEEGNADASESADTNAWEESLIADLRAHGGRPSQGPLAGHPLLVMYSKGAKSGKQRRSILTFSKDGDDIIVAGSKSGAPTHPAWYFNVQADPNVTVEVGSETFPATAKVETGAERDRLWNQHVAALPWFGDYPQQTAGRVIPIVRLTRKS
jgi:deazaflavin-dependent oxidoreductase (nitroreductase family)